MSEICYLSRAESNKITERETVDFDGLKTILSQPMLGKKNGRSWMPVSLNGDSRKGEAVTAVHFLVLDVERETNKVRDADKNVLLDQYGDEVKEVKPNAIEPPSFDQMLEKLATRQFKAIIHTSYSHSLEHPRYRLVFELSRPLAKDEVEPLGEAIASTLELDASSYDQGALEPARLFFLPRCPSNERLALFRCEMSDGKPLDVDAMLHKPLPSGGFFDGVNTQVNSYEYTTPANGLNSNECEQRINDLADALEFISSDDYYEWVRIGQCLHGLGTDGFNLWLAWSQKSQKFNHAEAVKKWTTFTGDNAGYQGVFATAQAQGWTNSATLRKESRKAQQPANSSTYSQQGVTPEYPEPVSLTPDTNKPTPYPVDVLPPILSDAVKAIAEKVDAPIAMVGQTVMGATVYLASTRTNAENALGQAMPLNTGFITLGDSGDRKSAAHRLAFLPVHLKEEELVKSFKREAKKHAEEEQGLSGKELKEFKKQNPPPVDEATLYSDATFEPLAGDLIRGKPIVFIDSDEGGQFFGGHSLKSDTRTATIGGYIQLLDNGKVSRKRSKGNEEGSGTAFNRRLSLHLMAQEITIRDALKDPILRGQGFLPRFFFTAPDSLKGARTLTREEYDKQRKDGNDDARLKRYWARISEILTSPEFIDAETGDVKPPVIPMTNDAHDAWLEFYNATERQSGRFGELGEISAFVSRVGDQARKLAASLAVFQRLDKVTGACMESAIALAKHSLNEWLRYTRAAVVSPVIQDAVDVFEWLTLPTHKTPWHRFHANRFGKSGLNRFRSAQKRNLVLGTLLAHHYLIDEGGNNYAINPKLLRTGESAESAENADNQTGQGLEVAEAVRKDAEKCGSSAEAEEQSAGNPQISAGIRNSSANETPVNTSYPQNPHNPQLSAGENVKQQGCWTGAI